MEVGDGAGMAWRRSGSLERPRRLHTGHLFLEGPAWSYRMEKRQRSGERSQRAKPGGIGLSEKAQAAWHGGERRHQDVTASPLARGNFQARACPFPPSLLQTPSEESGVQKEALRAGHPFAHLSI